MSDSSSAADVPDVRVYVVDAQSWQARVKFDSEKIYCYQKNPGEDFFHLILNGEVYLTHGDEKFCLRCALRNEILTTDRLFWQHRMQGKETC